MRAVCVILAFTTTFLTGATAEAKPLVLDAALHHLRAAGEREWSDFPARPEADRLVIRFKADRNAGEWALRLRQQDVKLTWKVHLNGKELGRLVLDENDTVIHLPVPAGRLAPGDNELTVEQAGRTSDDVRVGEVTLIDRPVAEVLSEAAVELTVLDGTAGKAVPTPCRITVLDDRGSLMSLHAEPAGRLAVRPGVVCTADGRARLRLPAGRYTVHAGRGFEYGIDTVRVTLAPGDVLRKTLTLRREVPTEGWASCDTHVHTLTYSGHGDATADERVLTIAAEGLELPVAAEHNRQVDFDAAAVRLGVRSYFTPVVGNEVTTAVGHCNIFPVKAGGPLPDHQVKDWKTLFATIRERTAAPVIVLNHPRDVHSGFRPFGPERHLALTGEDLDGWELRANAVEVVNSGAQQTDVMRLVRDWFGLLNHGRFLTPVGASDSHDVSRFIVGQGRTYVRCTDDQPGRIDVGEAVKAFVEGRVLVSCGLLAEITVNGKYGPGDLVPAADAVTVKVRVRGPSWTTAERVELYANGHRVKEARIPDGKRAGLKWEGEWVLPRVRHDVHLVAVATGPGVREPFWPIALPYQPTSPAAVRRVIGLTGAVWLDGDGDGKRTAARGYAERLAREAKDTLQLVESLAGYDEAVAAQAAALLRTRGETLTAPAMRDAARKAGPHVARGLEAYAEAWRESQMARARGR